MGEHARVPSRDYRVIKLTDADPKYWGPDQDVIDSLCAMLPPDANVLEIGPGTVPFPKAKKFVDIRELKGLDIIKCDVNESPLPFADKEFDFVYARHVLEDMFQPFNLCREMSRVAKAGFVETPSPVCEFVRGVDGGSPNWRGYHHHRFIIWPHGSILYFVSKFPLIEQIASGTEDRLIEILRRGSMAWNTRFYWTDTLKYKHVQCPQDFMLPGEYPDIIGRACEEWLADLEKPKVWGNS